MPATRITGPGGIIPRLAPRQLPPEAAQVAANVSVLPGEWRPLRMPQLTWSPSSTLTALRSIYRVDDETWWAWTVPHVRVERAPLEGEPRFVISGNGCPAVTTKALSLPLSASGTPGQTRALGIPAPVAAPTVNHSGGSGAAVDRFYVYTFVSDWQEESAPSPPSALTAGKVDGTWAITGMVDTPPNTGSITAASKTATTVTPTTSAAHFRRVGDTVVITGIVGMTDLNGTHVITAVPAPNQFTVALATAQTYSSGGTWTAPVPWGPCTKRIYRTAGTLADFQLVAEGVSGTSYNDTLTDAQIPGASLITEDWQPPPANLTGIVSMPDGNLVGWIEGGRTLCWCEPFQPHAWPTSYRRRVADDIVGIAPFQQSLGVVTTGMPILFTGIDPTALTPTRHLKPFPGLSRASVCSIADGLVFATRTGLARMDLGGVDVFTEGLFLPDQWHALQPANINCAFDGARLFIGTPVELRLFTINLVDGGAMVTAYQRQDCTWADPRSGALYFSVGARVYEFDALDNAPQWMDWQSREILMPRPGNLGAARVERDPVFEEEARVALLAEREEVIARNLAVMASVGGGRGAIARRGINALDINGSVLEALPDADPSINFQLFVDGRLIFSATIPNDNAFRLPSGYKGHFFSVRLQANTQVRAVVVGDTPQSLAEV